MLDRKLRELILAIASGEAPEFGTDSSDVETTSDETPALEAAAQSDDTPVADDESTPVSDIALEATESTEQSESDEVAQETNS